jgi:hypothetical protein
MSILTKQLEAIYKAGLQDPELIATSAYSIVMRALRNAKMVELLNRPQVIKQLEQEWRRIVK